MGPLHRARCQSKFLVVAIDYFTKWVEAKALATITASVMKDFVWQNIVCRFGIPRVIISDGGKQFDCSEFDSFCAGLHIQHRLSSVAYP